MPTPVSRVDMTDPIRVRSSSSCVKKAGLNSEFNVMFKGEKTTASFSIISCTDTGFLQKLHMFQYQVI